MLIGARECFFFLFFRTTRSPQQNEMIRDRWVGRSWGWHKLIHCGLIHSLVTLSPNVSGQFYTLPWFAGRRSRLHSRDSKSKGTTGSLSERTLQPSISTEMPRRHCRLRQTWARQNQYNRWVWNRAWRRAFMCKLRPGLARWLPAAPTERRLFDKVLQQRDVCRYGLDNLINIRGKGSARFTAQ